MVCAIHTFLCRCVEEEESERLSIYGVSLGVPGNLNPRVLLGPVNVSTLPC